MKVKTFRLYDRGEKHEEKFDKEVSDFLSDMKDCDIYKLCHFCYGSGGFETVVIYYF